MGAAHVIGGHHHLLNGEHLLNGGSSYARWKATSELMSLLATCAELRLSSGTVHERITENSEVIEVIHE